MLTKLEGDGVMSVVIVGGNERMNRDYIKICEQYSCRAKVLTKMRGTFKDKIGNPDLLVLLTNTMSHKMVRSALCEIKGLDTVIARCHSSSMTALKNVLEEQIQGGKLCPSK